MTAGEILEWMYHTRMAELVRDSDSMFPWIESIHVLALAVVAGSIAMVDLRLIGVIWRQRRISELTASLLPYTWGAFAVAVLSGTCLFVSNSMEYWGTSSFRIKLGLICAAGINMSLYHAFLENKRGDRDGSARPPGVVRMVGFISLSLWIGVLFLGRWIGFELSASRFG